MTRSLHKNISFLARSLRAVCLSFFLAAAFVPSASAADIEAVLDSSNGSSSFVVQDSNASPNTVAGVDSLGNMHVVGNLGVGSTSPRLGLDVDTSIYAGTVYYVGTAAVPGTKLGTDNALRPTMAAGYLNLLGGSGNSRISLGGDGIHFAAGDALEKVTITTAGNVGIGSVAPGTKLDVLGGVARVLNGATVPSVDHATVPGSFYVQNNLEVDGDVYLGDQVTVDNIVITGTMTLSGSTGYAGPLSISTTDPAALVVRRQSNGLQLFNIDTANMAVGVNTSAPRTALEVDGVIYGTNIGVNTTAPEAGLDVDAVIYAHQNVGVGTSNPAAKLDVRGATRVWTGTGSVDHAAGAGSLYVQNNLEVDGDVYLGDATTDNLTVTGALTLTGNTNYAGPVSISTTDPAAFVVRRQGNGAQLFNVDTANMKVGVNTTAPRTALEVDGIIYGTNIGVNTTAPQASLEVDGNVYVQNANIGVSTTSPRAMLEVGNAAAITPGSNAGALIRNDLVVDGNIYGINAALTNATVTGTGTTGHVQVSGNTVKATNLAGVNIFDSTTHGITLLEGGNVGIATTAPEASLEVDGVIYGHQNVGVGTSNPAAKLDVRGAVRAWTGTGSVDHATVPGSLYVQNILEVDGDVYLGDATTDNLTVTGALTLSGNTNYAGPVSISTTDPAALVVRRQGNGTQLLNVDTTTMGVGVNTSAPRTALEVDGIIYGTNIGVNTTAPEAGLDVDAVIYAHQNVGVGTSNPAAKLDVRGATRVWTGTGSVDHATGPGSLYVQNTLEVDGDVYLGDATTDNLVVTGALTLTGNTNYAGPVSISTTDPAAFVVRRQGNGAQLFNVDTASMGVGVNTTAPRTALEVDGIIYGANIGINSTAPRALLDVGGAAAIPAGSNAGALIKNDMVVDGVVYGTGGVFTGPMVYAPADVNVTTAGLIDPAATVLRITGSPAAVDIPALTTQIVAGKSGQEVVLVGTSDASTVHFHNGDGLRLSQGVSFTVGAGDVLRLVYDGGLHQWVEASRVNN